MQIDALKGERERAKFEHIRQDWFRSNDAAMSYAQKMIDRSIKAGQGVEGEKNSSPYLDPESPRTQAADYHISPELREALRSLGYIN